VTGTGLVLFVLDAKNRVGRILQHADALRGRQQLAQQRETLGVELRGNNGIAGDIAARPGQACDETGADRVASGPNNDRYGGCRVLRRKCGVRAISRDEFHLEPNELLREGSEELGFAVCVASFDEQILALHPAEFAQMRV
jgi:hypothetical protein